MIDLRVVMTSDTCTWQAKNEGRLFAEYTFKSKRQINSINSLHLIQATVGRFALMDLLGAKEIRIQSVMQPASRAYLLKELKRFKRQAVLYHKLKIVNEHVHFKMIEHEMMQPREMEKSSCFLGFTGGKDSTLVRELIQPDFERLRLFKIDFDDELFESDYHLALNILDDAEYKRHSTRSMFEVANVPYYQEEDLHAVFAAPYIDSEIPAQHLAVGLPWDVLNRHVFRSDGRPIEEYVCSETYQSLFNFQDLMHALGFKTFEIFSPIASISSIAIYDIHRRLHGEVGLRDMSSCWSPLKNGADCGRCLKCQRVHLIYRTLGMSVEERETTESRPELDFLFGSISMKQLYDKFSVEELQRFARATFIDEFVGRIDRGYAEKLATIYGLEKIINPLINEISIEKQKRGYEYDNHFTPITPIGNTN